MSRRKQPNPAKLGDADITKTNMEAVYHSSVDGNDDQEQKRVGEMDELENRISEDSHRDKDVSNDIYQQENENHFLLGSAIEPDHDSLGSVGTERGSWGSNTPDQASPTPSSCPTPSSGVSDAAEGGEDPYTLGVTDNTPYACKICNKAFPRSSLLSKHEQVSHVDQLSYKCTFCPRLFKHKRSRDRHIKLHTGDKKYKCTQCQTAFSRSDHLKIHMKTHDNTKPFKCPLCNRGYNTAAALTSHQQNHSKDGRSSRNRSPASTHTNATVSNQKPMQHGLINRQVEVTKWVCVYCNKEFSTINEMQNHVNADHEEILNGNYAASNQISLQLSPENKTSPTLNTAQNNITATTTTTTTATTAATTTTTTTTTTCTTTTTTSTTISTRSSSSTSSNSNSNMACTYACDSCTMQFNSIEKLRLHEDCVHWKPHNKSIRNSASFSKDSGVYIPASQSSIDSSKTSSSQPMQSHPTDLSRKRTNLDQGVVEEGGAEVVVNHFETDMQPLQKQRCYRENSSRVPHILNPNEEWSAYICSICAQRLPNFSSFMVHMDIHMSIDTTNSNVVIGGCCPLCNTHYHDQHELNNHIVLHTLNYKTGFCCIVCKKAFDDLKEINRHLLDSHTYTIYKCIICEEQLKTRSLMQEHMVEKHRKACEHYTCQFCPEKVFHTRVGGEMHILQHIPQMFSPLPRRKVPIYVPPFDGDRYITRNKTIECFICRLSLKPETFRRHLIEEHRNYTWNKYISEELDHHPLLPAVAKTETESCTPNFPYDNNLHLCENSNRFVKNNRNCVCDICGVTDFTNEVDMNAHKRIHHVKNKPGTVSLQCAYCKEYCKSRVDLENHMKNHQISSGKGKHKCNICDEIYTTAIILAEHKLSHCKIITGNTCTQCKAVLVDEQSFYSHQHQHSAVLSKQNAQISLPANCIVCCQTLQTDVEVKLHANFHLKHLLVHQEFTCSMCGRSCDPVVRNANNVSESLNVSMCKDCSTTNTYENRSTSNSPKSLQIKSEGSSEKSGHACVHCHLKFESEKEAHSHYALHFTSNEMNLICRLCREMCSNALELQAHVVKHSFMGAPQYSCYECSAIFTSTIPLVLHMTEEHEPKKPYECTTCQNKFFFRTELDHHQFEHAHAKSTISNLYPILDSSSSSSASLCTADKGDNLTKCPYCDMVGTQSYVEFHFKECPHSPEYRKQIEERQSMTNEDRCQSNEIKEP